MCVCDTCDLSVLGYEQCLVSVYSATLYDIATQRTYHLTCHGLGLRGSDATKRSRATANEHVVYAHLVHRPTRAACPSPLDNPKQEEPLATLHAKSPNQTSK